MELLFLCPLFQKLSEYDQEIPQSHIACSSQSGRQISKHLHLHCDSRTCRVCKHLEKVRQKRDSFMCFDCTVRPIMSFYANFH